MNKLKTFISKFKGSKTGLAYIWAVAALTIGFFPVIYWILSVLLDSISAMVFSMYTFLGPVASAWVLVKALVAALPFFVLVVTLLWSAVNAKAQSYEA
jgi:hypothetical protein